MKKFDRRRFLRQARPGNDRIMKNHFRAALGHFGENPAAAGSDWAFRALLHVGRGILDHLPGIFIAVIF